jgi:hypothetical protein
MKIRTGFVSNSSSASFIIKWGFNDPDEGDETTFDEAFCCLFGISRKDGTPNFDVWGEMKEIYDEIKENTTTHKNGEFETVFFTPMLNTIQDFGETAAILNLALDFTGVSDTPFKMKLIERKIED